jgi:hypothetical protein
MPRAQIKDEKTYRALRREGNSEEKSARIANAAAGSSRKKVGARGGKSPSYADWSSRSLLPGWLPRRRTRTPVMDTVMDRLSAGGRRRPTGWSALRPPAPTPGAIR